MNLPIATHLKQLRDQTNISETMAAIQSWSDEVITLDAKTQAELDQSRAYHRRVGDWPLLIQLIDLELAKVSQPSRRLHLLRHRAEVLGEDLLRDVDALRTYEQILEENPDDVSAREAIDRIRTGQDHWQAVAARFADEAEIISDNPPLAGELFLASADLLWRNAAPIPQIEYFLVRSLETDPTNIKTSQRLAQIYRQTERYEQLASLLTQQIDIVSTRREQMLVHLKLGDLYRNQLHHPAQALHHYRASFALDTTHQRPLEALARALIEAGDWNALVSAYETALKHHLPATRRLKILLELGSVMECELDDAKRAERCYRDVREIDPAHPTMVAFYEQYFTAAQSWSELVALWNSACEVVQSREKRITFAQNIAQVAEYQLGDTDQAIAAWKRVRRDSDRNSDTYRTAHNALKELCEHSTPPRLNALAQLLSDEIEMIAEEDVAEKIALLHRIATIYDEHLRLDVMAISTYESILQLDSANEAATAALLTLYQRKRRFGDLVSLLDHLAETSTDPADRVEWGRQSALLRATHLGEIEIGIHQLTELYDTFPQHPDLQADLEHLCKTFGRWRELHALLNQRLIVEKDNLGAATQRDIQLRLAEISYQHLNDGPAAERLCRAVLRENPHDIEARRVLADVFRHTENWPDLATLLEQTIAQTVEEGIDDKPSHLDQLVQLATIYTQQLRTDDRALSAWEAVLHQEPQHPKAIALLRELYTRHERWAALESLLSSRERFGELADTFSAAADRTKDTAQRAALLLRLGYICQHHLNASERAIKAYERAMATDPDSSAAYRPLIQLYRQTGRWRALIHAYDTILARKPSAEMQAEILKSAAQVLDRQLNAPRAAFRCAARAYALTPDDIEIGDHLESTASAAGRWRDLRRIYLKQLKISTDVGQQQYLLHRLAQIAADHLENPEEAIRLWEVSLKQNHDDNTALSALSSLYEESKEWTKLAETYHRQAALESDVYAKRYALLSAAQIEEERLGDLDQALTSYRTLFEQDRRCIDTVNALCRLFEIRSEWIPMADVLQRHIEAEDQTGASSGCLYRLAQLLLLHLEQPNDALDLLELLATREDHQRHTIEAIEGYLDDTSERKLRAARILAPLYHRDKAWRALARVNSILIEAETLCQRRIELLEQQRDLYDGQLEDIDATWTTIDALLNLAPNETRYWQIAADLSRRLGDPQRFCTTMDAVLEQRTVLSDPQLTQRILSDMARVLTHELNEPHLATPYLERLVAFEHVPTDAWHTLATLYQATDQWHKLCNLLERQYATTTCTEEKLTQLERIREINDIHLGDSASVVDVCERIIALEPRHRVALETLEQRYRNAEDWQGLATILAHRIGTTQDGAQRNDLRVQRAELCFFRLADVATTLDLIETVFQDEIYHQSASTLLKQVIDAYSTEISHYGEHSYRRASEALTEVLTERGRWHEVVTLLGDQVAQVSDRPYMVTLLKRRARLQAEVLGDIEGAIDSYRRALQISPEDEQLQQTLWRFADKYHLWDEASALWHRLIDSVPAEAVEQRVMLLLRLGEVYAYRKNETDLAQQTFTQAATEAAEDEALTRHTHTVIAHWYRTSNQWPQLEMLITQQIKRCAAASGRRALLHECLAVQLRLQSWDRACDSCRSLLLEAPGDIEILAQLEGLCRRTSRWSELVDVLHRRLELHKTPSTRRDILRRIAAVEHDCNNDAQAFAAHQAILADFPSDRDSLRFVAAVQRSQQDWHALAETTFRLVPLTSGEEKIGLLLDLADMHSRCNQHPIAIETYQTVLTLNPDEPRAVAALEWYLTSPEVALQTGDILKALYRKREQWAHLAAVCEREIDRIPEAERPARLRDIALLHGSKLGDPARACDAYSRAAGLTAEERSKLIEQVDNLSKIARDNFLWGDLYPTWQRLCLIDRNDPMFCTRQLTVAHFCWHLVGKPGLAAGHYEAVCGTTGANREAEHALDRIYRQTKQWDQLLALWEKNLNNEIDIDLKISRLLKLAEITDSELHDSVRSAEYLEELLSLIGRHDAAYRGRFAAQVEMAETKLLKLYEELQVWEDWDALCDRHYDQLGMTRAQIETRMKQAVVRAEHLDDIIGAIETYDLVLARNPDNLQAHQGLERLPADVREHLADLRHNQPNG